MFRTSLTRLRTWLETVDVLGDSPDDAPAPTPDFHQHPHRTPLRQRRERRVGSIQARPAHCLCPVRPTPARRPGRDTAVR